MSATRPELDRHREEAERSQRKQDGQFPKPGAVAFLAVIAPSEQDHVKPAPRQPNGTPDIERMIRAVAHPEGTLHGFELFLREAWCHIRGYAGQKPGAERPGSIRRGRLWESPVRGQSRGSHSAKLRPKVKHIVNKCSRRASSQG